MTGRNRVGLWAGAMLLALRFAEGQAPDPEKAFWEGDFGAAAASFESRDEKALSLEDRLLWIEILVRTGKSGLAEEKLRGLSAGRPASSAIKSAEASVHFAFGRREEAERAVAEALTLEPVSDKAVLTRICLSLYSRDFADSERWYKRLTEMSPGIRGSALIHFLGLRIFTALGDASALRRLYEERSAWWEDRDEEYADGLKADARLFRKAAKTPFFSVVGRTEEERLPFAPAREGSRANVIVYEAGGSKYQILLDTGNRAGWTIHHPGLLHRLEGLQGGRVFSEIGTHAGLMEGTAVFVREWDFDKGFGLSGLFGIYVPKPQPDFYDANLNPAFIRNRVVALDFIERRFRLAVREAAGSDSRRPDADRPLKTPWFGDQGVYVPMKAGGRDGLALIETGARDISINLDFARGLGLPLEARTRYLAGGEPASYHVTPVTIALGSAVFERKEAEVWPFRQLMDPLTGLIPDAVIGPEALDGEFVLTLDPFENTVILERRESSPAVK